jgi:hypothetical protein
VCPMGTERQLLVPHTFTKYRVQWAKALSHFPIRNLSDDIEIL